MNTYIKQAQSGRSMIEMLGVLAIIGVLSAGGIAGYSMAMSSYKTNAVLDKVQMISTQARILYNGTYGASTDNIGTNLVNLKYIADLSNAFGGTFTVLGDGANFSISASAIPADACVKLLSNDYGDSSIFVGANIGSTATAATGKVAVSSAATLCKNNAAETIVWRFK